MTDHTFTPAQGSLDIPPERHRTDEQRADIQRAWDLIGNNDEIILNSTDGHLAVLRAIQLGRSLAAQPPAAPVETGDGARNAHSTLWGQIAAIYGELDAEDCAWIDREWAKMRGYILPTDGASTLSRSSAETGGLAGALLKIAGAISQLKLAEESTSDEVTRRHLGEIISFLSSAAETSGQEG